jgi:hypothetical protein
VKTYISDFIVAVLAIVFYETVLAPLLELLP